MTAWTSICFINVGRILEVDFPAKKPGTMGRLTGALNQVGKWKGVKE
jgi:hypothetical protein